MHAVIRSYLTSPSEKPRFSLAEERAHYRVLIRRNPERGGPVVLYQR
jgi:hypothetical protein